MIKVMVDEDMRKRTNLCTWDLIEGKVYEVLEISRKLHWYKILDETGETFLYPPSLFKVVSEE